MGLFFSIGRQSLLLVGLFSINPFAAALTIFFVSASILDVEIGEQSR